MPLSACRYVAQEPLGGGGALNTPHQVVENLDARQGAG